MIRVIAIVDLRDLEPAHNNAEYLILMQFFLSHKANIITHTHTHTHTHILTIRLFNNYSQIIIAFLGLFHALTLEFIQSKGGNEGVL